MAVSECRVSRRNQQVDNGTQGMRGKGRCLHEAVCFRSNIRLPGTTSMVSFAKAATRPSPEKSPQRDDSWQNRSRVGFRRICLLNCVASPCFYLASSAIDFVASQPTRHRTARCRPFSQPPFSADLTADVPHASTHASPSLSLVLSHIQQLDFQLLANMESKAIHFTFVPDPIDRWISQRGALFSHHGHPRSR